MLGYYGYTMTLTYFNVISALFGMYFAINQNLEYAVVCLVCSGIFDLFDGIVARSKKSRTAREKSYGIQLDSLADIISFGVFPVVIVYSLETYEWWQFALMVVYILAALIRLAYFNATEIEYQQEDKKRTHYTGLPVTSAAIVFPFFYLVVKPDVLPLVYLITLPVMSIAFLIKVAVPKFRFDEASIRFLYGTMFGRFLLKILITLFFSRLVGWVLNRRISTFFIKGFVKTSGIDLKQFKQVKYKSFNDFFTREIEDGYRPFCGAENELAAPCDGKLSAYHITAGSLFNIKKTVYDIHTLLQDDELADEYMDGTCLIFRLTPDDYHRYSFIDDGEILSHKRIKGVFHTVRPIAHYHFKVFIENTREYTVMKTINFDKVIHIEVGAMFVGRISNRKTTGKFNRGEEKGMFEFGGSTIILLFKKDTIVLDDRLFDDTASDKETAVKLGSVIGKQIKKTV